MSQASYFTQEGLDKLLKELHQLKSVERPSISRQIAEARDKGDLSENAEYHAAKEAQGLLELKISKMEDIVVNEKYRRYGIGGKLFEEVVKTAKNMGVRKIDWQVLHWNEPAIQFYKKYNTVFSKEWANCTLYEKELNSIKL